MAPPIGAREIDGLPIASMAELLVTKQDPNSLIGSGKSPTNLEEISLNYRNSYIAIHAVDSEVRRSLKSNSVRYSQPTYEAWL